MVVMCADSGALNGEIEKRRWTYYGLILVTSNVVNIEQGEAHLPRYASKLQAEGTGKYYHLL